ncbi:hypothetical protein E4U14_000930 [Claviceps sp. LM454 group G7]|nr:hypothetical protein E4U14_000930 [Claviceps sp. LM454 group G7]
MAEKEDSFKMANGKPAWPPEARLDEVPTEFVVEQMQTDHSTVATRSEQGPLQIAGSSLANPWNEAGGSSRPTKKTKKTKKSEKNEKTPASTADLSLEK